MKTTINGGIYARADFDSRWHATPYLWLGGEVRSFADYIAVTPHAITFEVPAGFDPRSHQIAALETKRAELRAQFAAACTEIERQISKLQAIEHTEAA
jgi:hypothetical protein